MTPDEFTAREFFLDVGDSHQLYVHDWGNPKAKTPIIYLHGGPGSGCDDRDKTKFNPKTQRVIFYDQRGAGKSLPTGSLKNNTTVHLINDITMLAEELKISRFVLVGGSWGSTLALAYAIAEPQRVAGLLIDGVYTGTKAETDWLDKGGWREFFPEVWEDYQLTVPAAHRQDPTAYHYKQAKSGDAEAAKKAAHAYVGMEVALLKLDEKLAVKPLADYDPGNGLIAIHYISNDCFLAPNHILKNAPQLTMPVYIIQGRYDMVCLPGPAYRLSKSLPNSKLVWTINGHLKQHEAKNIFKIFIDQLTEAS